MSGGSSVTLAGAVVALRSESIRRMRFPSCESFEIKDLGKREVSASFASRSRQTRLPAFSTCESFKIKDLRTGEAFANLQGRWLSRVGSYPSCPDEEPSKSVTS